MKRSWRFRKAGVALCSLPRASSHPFTRTPFTSCSLCDLATPHSGKSEGSKWVRGLRLLLSQIIFDFSSAFPLREPSFPSLYNKRVGVSGLPSPSPAVLSAASRSSVRSSQRRESHGKGTGAQLLTYVSGNDHKVNFSSGSGEQEQTSSGIILTTLRSFE